MNTLNDLRTERWLLPDGVNELMPEDAWRVESLRRQIMDSCRCWGYQLVMPPLIEYLDSLLTGTGETLDLQTFKLIDQHNGRSLGIRADMTPQVARIDAHALRGDEPNRLFYTGSVLRARTNGAGSRTPLQFGAELFGHAGADSDIEIILLMIDNIMRSGLQVSELLLDVGHVGVYRALVQQAQLAADDQEALFQALLRGSRPEIEEILDSANAPLQARTHFRRLLTLCGDLHSVLPEARSALADAGQGVADALDNLQSVCKRVQTAHPELKVHLDLAELRGYRYHTGMLFSLYDQHGSVLAHGGRYDAIGKSFGRARAATGFSGDLIKLALNRQSSESRCSQALTGVWVAAEQVVEAWPEVLRLRALGERVVVGLRGSSTTPSDSHCDRTLVLRNGRWVAEPRVS